VGGRRDGSKAARSDRNIGEGKWLTDGEGKPPKGELATGDNRKKRKTEKRLRRSGTTLLHLKREKRGKEWGVVLRTEWERPRWWMKRRRGKRRRAK